MVQLKALTLLSPDTALKIECTAMQSSQQRSVHDLLKEKLPGPLEGQWAVTAAQVNLYYPPEPGRTRPKVVTIEVTSKGRLNLHKFDANMQAQLEGYLVAVAHLAEGPDPQCPGIAAGDRRRQFLIGLRGLINGDARCLGLGLPPVRGRHAGAACHAVDTRGICSVCARQSRQAKGGGSVFCALPPLPAAPGAGLE